MEEKIIKIMQLQTPEFFLWSCKVKKPNMR